MGTGDGPVGSNSGRIGEIAPSRSRGAFAQEQAAVFEDRGLQLLYNKFVKTGGDPEHIQQTLSDNVARLKLQASRQKDYERLYKKGKKAELRYPDKIVAADPAVYDTYNDFEKAVEGLPIHAQQEAEWADEKAKQGYASLGNKNGYETYQAETPEGLSKLAQGSNWCTRDTKTAKENLADYKYFVVAKENKPLAAIKIARESDEEDEVWHRSNKELRSGMYHNAIEGKQLMLQEDFDAINQTLKDIGQPKLDTTQVHILRDEQDRQQYIHNAFEKNDENAIMQILTSFREKLPQAYEQKILDNKTFRQGLAYVNATRERFPALEEKIVKQLPGSIYDAAEYAKAIGGRFPEPHRTKVEKVALKVPDTAVTYAVAVGGRFKESEKIIAEQGETATRYAEKINDLYPEPHRTKAEENIVNSGAYNSVRYARASGMRFKKAESIIAKDSRMVLSYIEMFLDDFKQNGFPEYEKHIENSVDDALEYVKILGGRRFPGAEEAIARKRVSSMTYVNMLSKADIKELQKTPAGQKILQNAGKS